eukprot:scaffold241554_cov14-Tisochrysis_lutea.AAC.1
MGRGLLESEIIKCCPGENCGCWAGMYITPIGVSHRKEGRKKSHMGRKILLHLSRNRGFLRAIKCTATVATWCAQRAGSHSCASVRTASLPASKKLM